MSVCTRVPSLDRPAAPRRGEARLLYQPSKRGTSQVSSQRESGQHNTDFRQPFSRSSSVLTSSVAVDTKRDCGQLTFADSEQQAKRRADTPEPFTQIHRCVEAFSVRSSAKSSECPLKGQSEVYVKPLYGEKGKVNKTRRVLPVETETQTRQRRSRKQAERE